MRHFLVALLKVLLGRLILRNNGMEILPLHPEVALYLHAHGLERRFLKQIRLLKINVRYPSLRVEILEPKHLRIYSFRVDRKYRAIFIFRDSTHIEIIDINDHYQ